MSQSDLVRIRALVAYDGSAFHGFAEQRDVSTVAGELRVALERVFGELDEFVCAGRTDAGVHGWGQVVHADVDRARFEAADLERVLRGLNKQLSPSIVVRELSRAANDFHARFSATARKYRYLVLNAPVGNPFLAATAWWVSDPLDIDAMNEASKAIVGEHDFTTFCRHPKTSEPVSLTRRILRAEWTKQDDDVVRFEIEANAFCHQMVRALTGTLVDIGKGRRAVQDMQQALEAKDRSKGSALAPPQGLCLLEVAY
jgi:tRNA pseudouridine38-40 synthase